VLTLSEGFECQQDIGYGTVGSDIVEHSQRTSVNLLVRYPGPLVARD
jgi:hypothetical protein